MNRLIILGNGFDLAHNLKTSYRDFLLFYLKKILKKAYFENEYRDGLVWVKKRDNFSNYQNYLDKESDFRELYNDLKNHFAIEQISTLLSSILNKQNESGWSDIESIFYQYLLIVFENKSKDRDRLLNQLNEQLDFLKEELIQYLDAVNSNFIKNGKPIPELVKIFNTNLSIGQKILSNSIFVDRTYFVNFNYTDTIEKYMKLISGSRVEEIQIHGNIKHTESVVFGYGDESDKHYKEIEELNDNSFFKHFKSFSYVQNDSYQNLMGVVNSDEKFEVYIVGHSLGLSDRTMLKQIFDSPNLYKVKIFYYESEEGVNDFVHKTYELSRHFSDKGNMRLKIIPFTKSQKIPQLSK